MKKLLLLLIVLSFTVSCKKESPEIKLPALFSEHMVLQQKSEVPLWGWATPGTVLDITTDWNLSKSTTADAKGNWFTKIKTPKAGGPYTLTIRSGNSIRIIGDIYMGEVWLASGQSNMEMPVKGWGEDMPIDNSEKEIASSDIPEIRMFTVERKISTSPEDDVKGDWKVSSPKNTGDFSATAYFFAKKLHQQLKVPIGIIHSSWGGTPAEAWTPVDFVSKIKGFENTANRLQEIEKGEKKLTIWLKDLKKESYKEVLKNNFKDEIHDIKYSAENFDDHTWDIMELPVYWETKQLKNFDGIVWFRKEFTIPKGTELKDLKLYLGKIDDMDDTYVNGKNVGKMLGSGFWDKERIYPLDENILHYGKNTISVKVIDNLYGGGIYGPEGPAILNKKNDTLINLSGKWKFKPVSLIRNGSLYFFTNTKNHSNMPGSSGKLDSHSPTVLYNAMIAPLIPYAIKGTIWYQGESNVGRASQYAELFPAMIKSWRAKWKEGDFPFYYVQIAPFKYNNREASAAAELRYAQFLALKVKNTGMVVTTDIGDVNNIHPSNKPEVGRRLALWALNKDYGLDTLICSGPLFKKAEFKKNKAVISFTHIAQGLTSNDEKLKSFEIAAKDSVFYPAVATIDRDKVIVSSRKVRKPKYVRFGWRNDAEPNLFNSAGLPASPFRN